MEEEEWDNIKVGDILRWEHNKSFHLVEVIALDGIDFNGSSKNHFTGKFLDSTGKNNIGITRDTIPKAAYKKVITDYEILIKALDILEDKYK